MKRFLNSVEGFNFIEFALLTGFVTLVLSATVPSVTFQILMRPLPTASSGLGSETLTTASATTEFMGSRTVAQSISTSSAPAAVLASGALVGVSHTFRPVSRYDGNVTSPLTQKVAVSPACGRTTNR